MATYTPNLIKEALQVVRGDSWMTPLLEIPLEEFTASPGEASVLDCTRVRQVCGVVKELVAFREASNVTPMPKVPKPLQSIR